MPALRKFTAYISQNWLLFAMAAPAMLLILAFSYIPMLGTVIAFEDYSPRTTFFSPWVGLRNFELLWKSPVLARLIRNTLGLNVMFIAAETFFAVTSGPAVERSAFHPFQASLPIDHVPALFHGLDDRRNGVVRIDRLRGGHDQRSCSPRLGSNA